MIRLHVAVLLCLSSIASAQSQPSVIILRCGALFDGKSDQVRRNIAITVTGDKITSIGEAASSSTNTIDLSSSTCLPGLIDTHTHVLLQGDITAEDYDRQLLKESTAYRAIVATQSARRALENGFTTIRDLETEGASYADVDLRNAINRGIVPGPRMQVATRALDVTGAYPLQGYSWEIEVPHGVQLADGPDEVRKAVREQISHGADWIKLYVDRSYFVRDNLLDDIPTFTLDEIRAAVDEAHRQRHKVAAHAMALQGVHNAVTAGVDSVEHGDYIADEDIRVMISKGIFYVPTIYVGEYVAEGRAAAGAPVWVDMVKIHAETFRRAVKAGVKIAFGTDVGGFDWKIDPAVEFPLMVKYGMTAAQALHSATSNAAELLGMQNQIGSIEAGKFADIIAVPGNPLEDVTMLQKVNFVMKGGMVYRHP